ncbi:iron chelate uptake ABC transporter family permease subunit, partial [Pantoea endophytica]|uniref:iron chelate uptake ABC transporter family permease subunit n=1 Tax=Pantoea endophytica TaxID=92488 RepID=UPI0028978249
IALSQALDSLSMGGDMATALGTRVARTQLLGLLAIALLCGAATAAVGPIAFVGLMTPHFARWLVGNDHRWMLPATALITPILLLAADILGRLLVAGELRVSIVTAMLGAPMLIALVRRKLGRGAL